jgi:drug/metabolite transporter (DMT)-like permease
MTDHERAPSHLWPGVPYALGAALLFGASTPAAKFLLGSIDPWLLAGIFYLGAGLGLFVVQKFQRPSSEAALKRGDIPWLLAVIVIGGVCGPLLLMFGLTRSSAGSASLLLNLEGLFTMGLAWLVFGENVDRRLVLGAFAILCGAALLTWDGSQVSFSFGAVLIAGACLAWGLDNNLTRKLSAADPVQIATYKGLVAGGVNVGLALYLGAKIPPLNFVAIAAVIGFFSVGISLIFFMLGLRHLGAARTGAYFSVAPFVGAAIAILVLQEPVTLQLVAAAALMGIGILIHLLEKHEHDHQHAALEHDHSHVHDEHHQHPHEGPMVEPHSHFHRHKPLLHKHPHYPDIHHHHTH